MRRILREAGEIPDMNAITEGIKYRLGFVEEGNPTPEILKNYMDVSTSPLHCSQPQQSGGLSLVGVPIPGGGETCQPPTSQEGKGRRDVDPVGQIHAPPWLSE